MGQTEAEGRSHVKTDAEIGKMQTQAEDRLEPPATGRGRKDPPLEPPEGAQPCPHLDLGLLASRAVEWYFSVYFKAPGLW